MFDKHKKSRKGVYGIVEEVMLFGIGILIMAGIITIFNTLGNEMLSTLGNDRLVALNKYIASSATMLYAVNCTSCYVIVELPASIGGKGYTVGGSVTKKILVYTADEGISEESIPVPAEGVVKSANKNLRVQYDSASEKISIHGVTNY